MTTLPYLLRIVPIALLALFLVQAGDSWAQFPGGGGRGGGRGGSSSSTDPNRTQSKNQDQNTQKLTPPATDPMAAIERELPSLRIDLKLDEKQTPLFDRFERKVHEAAGAARARTRHLSAFKLDDGSTVSASSIVGSVAQDDIERADAMRAATDLLEEMYAALQPEQRRQFDRRIMVAMRDPLGNS